MPQSPKIKAYGKATTHHDALKSLALLLMIIDHLGFYFWPEALWLRAIGRLSAPIWLFLIGYSPSSQPAWKLWLWGLLLAIAIASQGLPFFHVNILITIALCRLVLPWLSRLTPKSTEALVVQWGLLAALILPTQNFFDYGSFGLMAAYAGYLCRHSAYPKIHKILYGCLTLLAYGILCQFNFHFTAEHWFFLLPALVGLAFLLWHFRAGTFRQGHFANTENFIFAPLLRLCGRYTLEIFIAHHLLFLLLLRYAMDTGYFHPYWRWF